MANAKPIEAKTCCQRLACHVDGFVEASSIDL
jgi:hypothetical protein